MKIKSDFTTNSSSSSFVCWGVATYQISNDFNDDAESPLTVGGSERDFIGLTPGTVQNLFPDVKFGDIKEFVAQKLNDAYGTTFTANDITYYEEGWYDG
jgi:hypothetical protein